jgi:hypothetical protein
MGIVIIMSLFAPLRMGPYYRYDEPGKLPHLQHRDDDAVALDGDQDEFR